MQGRIGIAVILENSFDVSLRLRAVVSHRYVMYRVVTCPSKRV